VEAGRRRKLTGQPFSVLAILLERPGEVVTREELQKRLWPDTFVDVDHNLNTAINKIREALNDSSERPQFIETLSRRGFGSLRQWNVSGQIHHRCRTEQNPHPPSRLKPRATGRQLRLPRHYRQ